MTKTNDVNRLVLLVTLRAGRMIAVSVQGRFGDFLKQEMRLAVDDPMALADYFLDAP